MSFVGKILVVVQLVLSVLFMALAGAVFAVHTNWKAKFDTQSAVLAGAQKSVTDSNAELAAAKLASQKVVDGNKADLGLLTQQVATLTTQLEALKKKNNEDQQELQTQTALAQTKAREAIFRTTEAEEQRAANRALQASLDTISDSMRKIEDEKFGLQIDHDNLKDEFLANQVKMAHLERIVKLHKLETDPLLADKQAEPPPPVEGVVKVVQIDKTNRPKFIEISVGADDGLLKGHVLDVMRSGVGGKKSQYLGKVQIISIEPNRAVCVVVESAKNGIIEVGDNVTTKL